MMLPAHPAHIPMLHVHAGLGGAPKPKRDLHRFVKWPQYVRLQRQKRVLSMRLKVPPVVNQFATRALDKNQAETMFKLMLKYRPEDKKQKAERLKSEAEARAAGKEVRAANTTQVACHRRAGMCAHMDVGALRQAVLVHRPS